MAAILMIASAAPVLAANPYSSAYASASWFHKYLVVSSAVVPLCVAALNGIVRPVWVDRRQDVIDLGLREEAFTATVAPYGSSRGAGRDRPTSAGSGCPGAPLLRRRS